MADFDLGLGSDPFGGGSEGLTNFGGGADFIKANSSPVVLPQVSRGESGGLMDFAKGLFARGEDPGQPAAPGRPGGILGDISGGLGTFAKGIIPAAQLGLSGLNVKSQLDAAKLSKQQAGNVRQAQQMQREATQPLTQFGTTQLQRAEAGKVDPAVQAQIDQWVQGAKQKMIQFFAHNGITDSTMLQSALADIDAKAVAMKAGDLQLMEQLGVGALSQAANAAGGAANTAQQEQASLDNLIKQANASLAQMLA